MDPFSLTLGVIAVLQTTGQAAKTTYDFIQGVKDAPKEVRALNKEVGYFYDKVKQLQSWLNDPVIRSYALENPAELEYLENLKEPLLACKESISELDKLLQKSEEIQADGSVKIKSVRWYLFRKDTADNAREDLIEARQELAHAMTESNFFANLRQRALDFQNMKKDPSLQKMSSLDEQLEQASKLAWRLRKAACDNDEHKVVLLLDAKVAVDSANRDGRTPLSLAAQHGSIAVARLLLQRGARVNLTMNNISGSDVPYHRKRESKRTPLHWAAAYGHLAIVRLLLNFGADRDARTTYGRTPVLEAMVDNKLEVVTYLLDQGASVNSRTNLGWTMLHDAAANGKVDAVRMLIERGADVEAVYDGKWYGNSAINKDATSQRPLHFAAFPKSTPKEDELAIIKVLIKKGRAKLEAKDSKGATPLHYAVRARRFLPVRRLLKLGASPTAKDLDGNTPLHYAAEIGNRAITMTLRQYTDEDPSEICNRKGKDVQTVAQESGAPLGPLKSK